MAAVSDLQPELASMNAGSLNFALFHVARKIKEFKYPWEKPYLESTEDYIFPNTFKTMREYCQQMAKTGTKPEVEIYDVAMINNLAYLIHEGHITKPIHLQYVMGILGGIPATVANLSYLYERSKEAFGADGFTWSVCAAGKFQLPMAAASLAMGGHVRVGLEDSMYVEKGTLARSSAEQVEKVVVMAQILSREVATPEETRQILNLKGLDKVNF